MRGPARAGFVIVAVAAWVLAGASSASAHCDGMDGPVVGAARSALETGNLNSVLIWVRRDDEGELRRAFDLTRNVRQRGDAERELADRYFFETVVRLHRAGEGEPFTGLKPAGRDLGPAIPAADAALEAGSADALSSLLTKAVGDGVAARFARALDARRAAASGDVTAGREFVAAYVSLLHYVEQVHAIAGEGGPAAHDPHR